MDHAAYHVLYVDTRMSEGLDGTLIQTNRASLSSHHGQHHNETWEGQNPDCLRAIIGEIEDVRTNLKRLLTHFDRGKLLFYCVYLLSDICNSICLYLRKDVHGEPQKIR